MIISVDAAKPGVWLSLMKRFRQGGLEEEIKAFAPKIMQLCTITSAVYLFITQKCFKLKWVKNSFLCPAFAGCTFCPDRSSGQMSACVEFPSHMGRKRAVKRFFMAGWSGAPLRRSGCCSEGSSVRRHAHHTPSLKG